ncbi:hypothetical protein ABW20_dc0108125 [Dactylellina cionopaga]|nr:hypothetical protein ABW20_dc0108125 [Dactylellina cionopaga]
MLPRLILLSSFAVIAAAQSRYSERYIFYIYEPQLCGDGPCDDEQFAQCGAGRQCAIFNGKSGCGTWAGNKNYCCTFVHTASNDHNCYEDEVKDFIADFSFSTTGTPVVEEETCTRPGAFVSFGIKSRDNDLCCDLAKDAVILLKNGTTSYSSSREVAGRCVDALMPSENSPSSGSSSSSAPGSSSPTPSPTAPSGGSTTSAGTGASTTSASSTPNAAVRNGAYVAGLIPLALMLAGL